MRSECVFGIGDRDERYPLNFVKSFFSNLKFYYKAWHRLEIMNKAASLSFYTIISVFPLVLLLATLSGYLFSEHVTMGVVSDFVKEAMPYQSDLITNNLQTLFVKKNAFSWLGFVMLMISAQILFVNFEKIVNGLLHTDKKRHFITTRFIFVLWLLGVVVMQFVPIIFEMVTSWLAQYGVEVKQYAEYLSRGGVFIFGLLVFWIMMTIIPTRRLNVKRLLLGAICFSATIQLGKFIFKVVTFHNLQRYNLIYGSLSSIILGTLWIFYFYNMLLFFAYWVGRHDDPYFLKPKGQ